MAASFKDILNFTLGINISDINNDGKHVVSGGYEKITFEETNDGDTAYFIKLEKMYLSRISFPVRINYESVDTYPEYALMNMPPKLNQYHRFIASNVTNVGLFAIPGETVISHNVLCDKVNKQIQTYADKCKTNNIYLYVPYFDIKDGKLICTYVCRTTGDAQDKYSCVIGFDRIIYELIGRYFTCEWGKMDVSDKNYNAEKMFYYVYPFLDEVEYLTGITSHPENRVITAQYQVDDFFYPERELIIEFTRKTNTKFKSDENGYKKIIIPFNEKSEIVELNSYIMFANNTTIRESKPTNHNFRISTEIDINFYCNNKQKIILVGKIVPLKDTYDQFELFNLNVGDSYTEEQFQELSYRKLLGLSSNNVYVQNEASAEKIKELLDIIKRQFQAYGDVDESNITTVLRRIYDILCQSQQITNLGPPLKKSIKLGIDL